MNLKNNKGVLGIDISVAVIIIFILIPIITGMIYNINKTNANIKRKSQALNIAINCMEIYKSQSGRIKDVTEESIAELVKTKCNMDDNYVIKRNGIPYKIELNLSDELNESNNTSTKELTANVKYKSGTKMQSVELATSIEYNT